MKYLFNNLDKVAGLFVDHLYLVFISLFISICIATPISIIISRFKKLQTPVIGVLGVIYTIPTLALFALLIPFVGLGFKPAVTVLVVFTQMALVRNMVAGINGIDPAVIEAAQGMGMSRWRIMKKIIIPLSLPVVVAGVRIATVSMIGVATLAAFINAGGLGELIFEGIYQDHPQKIIAGAVAVAMLAVVAELMLRFIERKVSWKEKGKVV